MKADRDLGGRGGLRLLQGPREERLQEPGTQCPAARGSSQAWGSRDWHGARACLGSGPVIPPLAPFGLS